MVKVLELQDHCQLGMWASDIRTAQSGRYLLWWISIELSPGLSSRCGCEGIGGVVV